MRPANASARSESNVVSSTAPPPSEDSSDRPLVFHSVLTCARCGQENPEGASFCNACGAPLAEPGRTTEERRVVSIVFVDLVGFTARSEKLDPEDVRAILTPYYERVRAELERFGGTGREVHRRRGDGRLRRADVHSETTTSARFAPRSRFETGPAKTGSR